MAMMNKQNKHSDNQTSPRTDLDATQPRTPGELLTLLRLLRAPDHGLGLLRPVLARARSPHGLDLREALPRQMRKVGLDDGGFDALREAHTVSSRLLHAGTRTASKTRRKANGAQCGARVEVGGRGAPDARPAIAPRRG
eukprot:2601321-Rhodomonas_salina.1